MCKEKDGRNRYPGEEVVMFEEVYCKNYELLLRFAAAAMDTEDYREAEKFVQEVFFEALRNIKEISSLKDPSDCLLRMTRLKLKAAKNKIAISKQS